MRYPAGRILIVSFPRDQIWASANLRGGASLSRHEFHIAMRLVAMAQAGLPATREQFVQSLRSPLPLPRFSLTGPWSISPADQAKYDSVFASTSKDGGHYVEGRSAVELFSKSGLDKPTLKHSEWRVLR